MFSGLTNQVSSWMGAAKGEPQDEEVPTPAAATQDAPPPDQDKTQTQSPTKSGSRLDMFTNVKSQMTGWLGSGIPIPGLRKGAEAEAAPAEGGEAQPAPEPATDPSADIVKDEDDNSSATGGADSGPASPTGTPTEENTGQIGNVTTKAVAGAKSLGSFLYSAVNKAGAKVSEAGAKIKKTVEENSLLGEFNKEQEAFIRGQSGKGGVAELPWIGRADEAALKEECLSLSTDRRNFVRAPPAGVEFNFDYDISYPIAIAIMAEDPNLEKMRFDLVPKVITEENFWRNYFYRVSLICQASEASDANNESQPGSRLASVDEPQEDVIQVPHNIAADLVSKQSFTTSSTDENKDLSSELISAEKNFEAQTRNLEKRVKGITIDENNKDVKLSEEEWETELEAELKDYESTVSDKNNADDKQWEKDCQDLLGDDDEDLK
ncbi:synapse-associated protein 47kD isoform X2 [Arctopsyche grandis]|uniref:synapse-associated protein 47kD isoform X2 n=1 Tax=Arctopsyche grandis TaxID=121162 RepID=UPI00406DA0CB